jgi:translation initiation factor 1
LGLYIDVVIFGFFSMAGKSPGDRPSPGQRDRKVYSEFGSGEAAFERAVPDLPPQEQSLRVEASRKGRGGKTVTVIRGFSLPEEKLTALAKQLKAQCGTGGTAKDGTIEIQGDHKQKLVELLIQKGFKAKASGG